MRWSLKGQKVKIKTLAGVQEGTVTNDYEENGKRKIRVLTRNGSFVREEKDRVK